MQTMQRKLVVQGAGAYTISLPVEWIRKQHLNEGNLVHIDESNGNLIVSGLGKAPQNKAEVHITTDNEKMIRLQLQVLYRLGYDQLSVFYQTEKQKEILEQICTQYLLGFEVTKEEKEDVMKKVCVLENVTEPSAEKQDVLLRRMFRILAQSMQLLLKETQEGHITKRKEIEQWTQKLDQYDNFCRRNISKQRFTEEGITLYWTLYMCLHLMQRNILHIHEHCGKVHWNKKIRKEIAVVLKQLVHALDVFDHAFYEKNLEILHLLVQKNDALLYKKIHPLLQQEKNTALFFHYLAEFTRLLTISLSPAIALLLYNQREQKS